MELSVGPYIEEWRSIDKYNTFLDSKLNIENRLNTASHFQFLQKVTIVSISVLKISTTMRSITVISMIGFSQFFNIGLAVSQEFRLHSYRRNLDKPLETRDADAEPFANFYQQDVNHLFAETDKRDLSGLSARALAEDTSLDRTNIFHKRSPTLVARAPAPVPTSPTRNSGGSGGKSGGNGGGSGRGSSSGSSSGGGSGRGGGSSGSSGPPKQTPPKDQNTSPPTSPKATPIREGTNRINDMAQYHSGKVTDPMELSMLDMGFPSHMVPSKYGGKGGGAEHRRRDLLELEENGHGGGLWERQAEPEADAYAWTWPEADYAEGMGVEARDSFKADMGGLYNYQYV